MQHQIDATNCLGILEFGETHGCPEVVAKAWGFLLENFEAVQRGEEFPLLGKERLAACLAHEGLQVRSEHARVEAALAWARHQETPRRDHLTELLGLSRLALLSPEYLRDRLLTDGLVQGAPGARQAVEHVLQEVRAGGARPGQTGSDRVRPGQTGSGPGQDWVRIGSTG